MGYENKLFNLVYNLDFGMFFYCEYLVNVVMFPFQFPMKLVLST